MEEIITLYLKCTSLQKLFLSNWNVSQRQEVFSESIWPLMLLAHFLNQALVTISQMNPAGQHFSIYPFLSTERYLDMQKCPSLPASETSKFLFLAVLLYSHRLSCHMAGMVSLLHRCVKREKEPSCYSPLRGCSKIWPLWKKKLVIWPQTAIKPQMTSNKTFQKDRDCQCLLRCRSPSQTGTPPAWVFLHDWLSVTHT